MIKGERILVTGAGGFIASHLVEKLAVNNHVVAFVHYNSLNRWGWMDAVLRTKNPYIEIFNGDICDPQGVETAMKDCTYVFHLAALIGIPYSYHSPSTYVDVNIKGTLNVLNAARKLNVKRIVHTSTSEVYGTAQFVPITEEHPVNPQSPYAATKASADYLAISYYCSFDLPVIVARPFNTYGPRQSARAIIPTIITQILNGSTELSLGSLEPTRDLNFVEDTADGFIALAESNALGEVVNIGTGKEISIGDLVQLIAKMLDKKITTLTDKDRIRPEKSEVERLLAANDKIMRLSTWKPNHTLDQGLKKTITWFSDPQNLSIYKSGIYNI